jgi:Lon protease-like protein
MTLIRIPLFPLPLVLFPHAILPLHIFEPRYKQMIRECIDAESKFGVILAGDRGIAKVGCTAEVTEVTRQFDDGRMDIQVEGRGAFEIESVVEEKPYYEANVRMLEDDTDAKNAAIPENLLELYARCHILLFGGEPEEFDRDNNESLAFAIAEDLPLDVEDKQTILALRDENERLARLVPMLNQLIPQAEVRYRMRRKAGGNGHASA